MVKRSANRLTVEAPSRLDGFLRASLDLSWGKARALVEKGRVTVDGQRAARSDAPLRVGAVVEIGEHGRPAPLSFEGTPLIAFADAHVVVVRKPAGVSTVPFEPGERGTLDELVARALPRRGKGPRPSLGVVHRLDKETSGLMVFTRTWLAKQSLAGQFRRHTVHRRYLAIAHGAVPKRTMTTFLIADRGDGLRGSSRLQGQGGGAGQRAVTHIEPLEALGGATLVSCRLETGRTHQIRIHLAELGHPLLGERVYVRDYREPIIHAPRVMLHAAELGFVHPKTEEPVRWEEPPPEDFAQTLARLAR